MKAKLRRKSEKSKREVKLNASVSANNARASKFGVNFFERGNTLYIRLTHEGQKLEKSLAVSIRPGTLNNKTQTIVLDTVNTSFIQSIYSDLNQTVSKLRILNRPINLGDVLEAVLRNKGITDGRPTFQQLLEVVLNNAKKKYENGDIKTPKSLRRYEILYLDVLTYFESLHNSTAIKLEVISHYDVAKMIDYYRTVMKFESETIRKRVEFGQRAYEIARQKKLQEHNPFHGHRLRKPKNYAEHHITEDELKSLMIFEFNSAGFEEVRDYFVFQCFTGLNYGDFVALKSPDIQEHKRGLAILQNRGKTGTQTFIPLLPEAITILNKYKNPDRELCFLVPPLHNFNRILKEIALIVGIQKSLTTKYARKTICNLAYDKGMDMESLGLIVGHKTAKTTHRYYIASQAPNRAFTAMENLKSNLK